MLPENPSVAEMQNPDINHSRHSAIVQATIANWPEHASFLNTMLQSCDDSLHETAEIISDLILKLTDNDLDRLIQGYRWMCNMMLEEELVFRRTNAYRYNQFDDVLSRVYTNSAVMAPYMDGLLLSQALWLNHVKALDFYMRRYLPMAKGSSHLEVGPGHGLLLYLAARAGVSELTAWDVSEESLSKTEEAFRALGSDAHINLTQRSVYDPGTEVFESIVISEVLEHIENPKAALDSLFLRLAPGGVIYVNAPVNSPAIDHIYLFRTPEELVELVRSAGFEIVETCFAPVTGYTEERARKHKVSISCGIIGRKAA